MKSIQKIALIMLLTLAVFLAFPTPVSAHSSTDDQVVFGDTFRLESGEEVDNLYVMGGTATLEEGSTVNGSLYLMGGVVDSNGQINGSVQIFGGSLKLRSKAVVDGDVDVVGGSVTREEGADIKGDYNPNAHSLNIPNIPDFNGVPNLPDQRWGNWDFTPGFPYMYYGNNMFMDVLGTLGGIIIMAILAMLAVLLLPRPIERVAQAAVKAPGWTGGMGLLTLVVVPFLLVIMVLTCILSVLVPVVVLALVVAGMMGWIAIGLELGKQMGKMLKVDWHPAIYAGIGTLVMCLVSAGMSLVPFVQCFSWIPSTIVLLVGLGAALLTFFGSRNWPNPAVAAAAPAPAYTVVHDRPVVESNVVEPAAPVVEETLAGETPASPENPAEDLK
ncbi:MAG TPA: hypothetical protein PKW33_04950 [Anaerolineaceae bacterium]|nr:hypothetical protein [Anaerolineaceae bacterium]HPN50911.1 hypothetical protein [Anaerolineaceae bacterium]